MSEYRCKKCGQEFDELNEFKGHNLKCKEKPKKRERVPLGVPRRKLAFAGMDEENYSYRVIHNRPSRPNRVNEALNAGYEFVESDELLGEGNVTDEIAASTDSRVTSVVGEDEKGNPMTGYLMRIPREFCEEDQAKKQELVNKREEAILKGVDSQGRPGQDGRYIPTDGGQPITNIQR